MVFPPSVAVAVAFRPLAAEVESLQQPQEVGVELLQQPQVVGVELLRQPQVVEGLFLPEVQGA